MPADNAVKVITTNARFFFIDFILKLLSDQKLRKEIRLIYLPCHYY